MAMLTVGAGQEYSTLTAAVAAAQTGDTIQVQAGTYTNDFPGYVNGLTIEGVGGQVNLVATDQPGNGKAILDVGGNTTLENLSFSGVTVPDGNGAGVRYEGGDLTIKDCVFDGNQDGLLGNPDPTGTITVDHSEFYDNGTSAGNTHNIYIGDIQQFTLTNSYVHDANTGHEVKSRAENNTIENNRIYDNGSTSSYSIDLPNGGDATVSGNTIEQGANGDNGTVIAYGEEGGSSTLSGAQHSGSGLTFSNNTMVNDMTAHTPLLLWNAGNATVSGSGNSLYGLDSSELGNGVPSSSVSYTSTRPALDTSSPVVSQQPTPTPSPTPTPTPDPTPTPSSGDTLTLQLTADTTGYAVGYYVTVDSLFVGSALSVSAQDGSTPETLTIAGDWGAGPHQIGIAEVNYVGESTASHDLQVHGITYDGTDLLNSTVNLGSFAAAQVNTAQPGAAQVIGPGAVGSWGQGLATAISHLLVPVQTS